MIASSEESTIAASCACAAGKRLRSEMSRATWEAPITRSPCLMGDMVSEIWDAADAVFRYSDGVEMLHPCPASTLANIDSSSPDCPAGTRRVMDWPIASSAVKPYRAAAPRFHVRIVPARLRLRRIQRWRLVGPDSLARLPEQHSRPAPRGSLPVGDCICICIRRKIRFNFPTDLWGGQPNGCFCTGDYDLDRVGRHF